MNVDPSTFVDIEAVVDDGDREDEEDADAMDDDDFIEETVDSDSQYTPWKYSEATDETPGFIAALEERYSSHGRGTAVTESDREERLLDPVVTSSVDILTRMPTHDDYPLWRVRCKRSLELQIVSSLFTIARPRHEIRSVFSHWSVEGWVYLEATMNECLRILLQRTPGIIYHRNPHGSRLILEQIDFSDGMKLLSMHRPTARLGGWVRVQEGLYEGDVGFVASVESQGVQLLLVPRLSFSEGTVRPLPALLDFRSGIDPTIVDRDIPYTFRGNRFERRLLTKTYNFSSVSANVSSMSLDLFSQFVESGHPKLFVPQSTFPIPSDWHFEEGDRVYIVDDSDPPAYDSGGISTVRTTSADVDTKEGIVTLPWLKIRKIVCEGDFVEITGGNHRGETGWVDGVEPCSQVVNVIRLRDEKQDKLSSDCTRTFQVHTNLLKHSTVPLVLSRTHPTDNVAIPKSERVPWVGMEIIVTGPHWYKTCKGVITNVLCHQHTPSGLRVEVRLNVPSRHVVLDYDHVGDASYRGCKLHISAPPTSQLFEPRNTASGPPKLWPLFHQPSLDSQSADDSPGYATPMPQAPFPSSPAWDPGSSTPRPESNPEKHNSSLVSPVQAIIEHILFDSRLLNIDLRVVATGGSFVGKELTVSVQSKDGQPSFQRRIYKRSDTLHPNWVTPRYPNLTRDNGLFVVIKGEHCGKYVLRIHHRYDGNVAIATVAVVRRVAGLVDNLTGELLEFNASDYLCACEVSKEDKKLHCSLANPLRERARKTRAK